MTRNDILCVIQNETLDIIGKRLPLSTLGAVWTATALVIAFLLRNDQQVQIPHIGILRVVGECSRERWNPRTGEHFIAPACKRVKFKTSGTLHAALNPPKTEE